MIAFVKIAQVGLLLGLMTAPAFAIDRSIVLSHPSDTPQAAPEPSAPPPSAPPPSVAPPAPAPSVEPPAPAPQAMVPPPPPPVSKAPRAPQQPQRAAETYQDCPTCPVMVKIPGGSFMMGQSDDHTATPVRQVTLRSFSMAQHPVTVAEWKACVADGACELPRMIKASDASPVHNVSWDDAQSYIAWLSKKTRHQYRLPSEAEWEYGARARTTTRYWWGNDIGIGLANCGDCGGKQDHSTPLPVESFKPNNFGLYDMNGGIGQWVADCWSPNYLAAAPDGSPHEQRNCIQRVVRGGSFRTDHTEIAAASRNFYDADVRYIDHGFRVVAD